METRIDRTAGRLGPGLRAALLLGLSLLFAGAILAASWFLEAESAQVLVWILIAIWWVPFTVLSSASPVDGDRRRCGWRVGKGAQPE